MADTDSPASPLLAFYLGKRGDLVRFFTLRTSSPAEAEDIVQDIYVKIAKHAETPDNPAAYLYRLGANVMIDRARARRRSSARDDTYSRAFRVETPAGEVTVDAPDPDAAIDARQRLARVMAVVDAMPPQRRRVFLMHKIEGVAYADIGARLGISQSAVEKHMIAALKSLADQRP
ncbi:MAG: sigma-70 family RNA polymerase sigma factor [Proteobacteria bacterium]|nr:sigma-70 family RNA polymerase sigma factor [Pseudomonadota bacterium]